MRPSFLIGFAGALAVTTACGGLTQVDQGSSTLATPPDTNPGSASGTGSATGTGTATGTWSPTGTGSGTGGSGTGAGTGAGTGTGTGTGAPLGLGARFDTPYATNASTSCALSVQQLNDIAGTLTAVDWEVRIGGNIHPDVATWAGALTPGQFWGGQITSVAAINPPTMEALGYGFETDLFMNLINPTAPTPLTTSAINGGLARGYYELTTPYLLTVDSTWSAGHLAWATKIRLDAWVGVQSSALVDFTIDGTLLNSVLVFHYGDTAWDGDLQGVVGTYCSVYLDFSGRPVTPI